MLLSSEVLNTVRKRIDESKQIPNYSNYVILPNEGLIYSLYWNKFVGGQDRIKGYWFTALTSNNGKIWKSQLHRVIYTACYGEIPEGLQVNHIDENKSNNCISNLNLMTPKDNTNWGTRNKRMGEKLKGNTNSRFKPKMVGAYKDGKLVMTFPSTREAQRNGFNATAICFCCNGKKKYKTHKGYEWRYIETEKVA